jgi:hypothetical protein
MAIITANNQSMTAITSLSGVTVGNLVLLSTETASSSSTVTFDSSIDSTYKEYIFKYYDVHPSAGVRLAVNFRDGSTAYDATKTSTFFEAYQNEAGTSTSLAYVTDYDLAQSTAVQSIGYIGNENDESCAGTLHLYDPSNTTFVKHYIATTPGYHGSDLALTSYVAGYCNVTAAIDGVQFSMTSGNIDSGTFKMYGVS